MRSPSVTQEVIEIFSDPSSKISLIFSKDSKSDHLVADAILYESNFQEEQNLESIYERAKSRLKRYVEILKFSFEQPSIELGDGQLNERSFDYAPIVIWSIDDERIIHSPDEISSLASKGLARVLDRDHEFIDEYVARYNAINQIKDPIYQLISFVSLMEYIEANKSDASISEKCVKKTKKGREIPWYKAARNLVAHGVIDQKNSLDSLNEKLGTSDRKIFFDRQKHLDIVYKAIEIYVAKIGEILDSLI
jgi:hypothetical protein